ncbi:MAG: hypothetical protein V4576_00050 [Patescibacteria group bacterium]
MTDIENEVKNVPTEVPENKFKAYLVNHSTEILTKTALYIGIIIIVISCLLYVDNIRSVPTTEQIEPVLKDFMTKEGLEECTNGIYAISNMSDVTVGEYDTKYKAWPIYATYNASCQAENFFYSRSAVNEADNRAAVAYVQKKGFGYRLFVPKTVSDVQEFKDKINGEIKEIKDKVF